MQSFRPAAAVSLVLCAGACGGDPPSQPTGTPNERPTASFTVDVTEGSAPLEVRFDASSSTDADGRIDVEGQVALPPEVRTIGTIEGELTGSIVHGEKRVVLYDRLTGRRVICCFGNTVSRRGLDDAVGKRIAVTGEIRSRRSGERASIDVSSYYVFPPEHELPSAEEVRGSIPSLACTESRTSRP